jgi:hypothetical protein
MRSDGQLPKSQTDIEKTNDLIAWRNLGLPKEEREPFLLGFLSPLCCAQAYYTRLPCKAWGSYYHQGSLFCGHHKPEGAEKL